MVLLYNTFKTSFYGETAVWNKIETGAQPVNVKIATLTNRAIIVFFIIFILEVAEGGIKFKQIF